MGSRRQVKVIRREEVNLCGDVIRTKYYLKKQKSFMGITYFSTIVDGYSSSPILFDNRGDILKFLNKTADLFKDELVEEIDCSTLTKP